MAHKTIKEMKTKKGSKGGKGMGMMNCPMSECPKPKSMPMKKGGGY